MRFFIHGVCQMCRYGRGVTREVGEDLLDLGAKNVLVVTDPNLASIPNGPVDVVQESLKRAKVNFKVYEYGRLGDRSSLTVLSDFDFPLL